MTTTESPITNPRTRDRDVAPRSTWRGLVAGLLAVGAALGVAELVTGLFSGTESPLVSVGETVIDHATPGLKDFAIQTWGTNDKPALVTGTLILLVIFGAGVGTLATRWRRAAPIGVAVFVVIGVVAALGRPGASLIDALPTLAGAAAALVAFHFLLDAAARSAWAPRPASTSSPFAGGVDRRGFLVTGIVVGGVAAFAGGLGRSLQKRFAVTAEREGIVLPAPTSPAAALPADADAHVPGLPSFITPNDGFYRIDTAIVVPQVSAASWTLRIHGMVDREITLDYASLTARPMIERDVTLTCVSNEIGGPYIGNARWLGVPFADVLREAGVHPDANQIVSRSVDGWTCGTPTAVVLDGRDAMIAVGMNGQPLPVSHGFPARLVVPGLYGYVSATKWVTDIELTTMDAFDAYWVRRGWSKEGPIKTMSRIDTPRAGRSVAPGTIPIAGVAWAQTRGIQAVEVRVDDGPWQAAQLGGVPTNDTWRQWVLQWTATPGRHTIAVRATDGTGAVQTEESADVVPDGATGWHTIQVLVNDR